MMETKVQWGPIGNDVYRRTYSRPMSDGQNEEWFDTVDRVVRGSTELGPEDDTETLRTFMQEFKLIPAGRHLWVTGTGLPFSRNCFRAPATARLADHFEFMANQLLTGGGVGANYSNEYTSLAPIVRAFDLLITIDPSHVDYDIVREASGEYFADYIPSRNTMMVADSREGWVAAWGTLFDFADPEFAVSERPILAIDLSKVRPSGAPILTFGGTASGPAPLAGSLVKIHEMLNRADGRKLTGLEWMLADHHIASAVVAGGARRSARMSIMHWRDEEILDFIQCKADHMHHWTTNISVEIDNEFISLLTAWDPTVTRIYRTIIQNMAANGEPGFYNSSLASVAETGDVRCTNPCGEVPLEEGESCNIGSVNLDAIGTDDEVAIRAFRLMTRFLLRATMKAPFDPLTAAVEARNRRIGVGFLGLQGWAAAHGVRYSEIANSPLLTQKMMMFRKVVRAEADSYSKELGIPSPIKVTAIAPNGTIALLPGTQPGAHAIIARHYLRNVRYTTGDPRIEEARNRGLQIEPCIYADNTIVVSYPTADPLVERFSTDLIEQADEVSLDDQLSVLAWVTETFCSGADGNGVSFTANYDSDHMTEQELYSVVMKWLPVVKGITVFPAMSRPQAPYMPITAEEYGRLVHVENHDVSDDALEACTTGACPIR